METNKVRPRLPNACDFCRKRKVRCDSAQKLGDTCSNCLKESIDCTHTAPKKKRGPRAIPRTSTSSRKDSSSVHSIIDAIIAEPETYPIPEDPNVVRKMLLDIAYYTRSLKRQVSQGRQVTTQHELSTITLKSDNLSDEEDSSESESSEHDTRARDDITGSLQSLTLRNDASETYRHIPKSSSLMMLKTAALIKEEILGEQPRMLSASFRAWRREFWTLHPWQCGPEQLQPPLTFPEDDLLHSLCNLYFTIIQPYIPLLHQSQFETAISDGLHLQDRKFGLVVLGVCAVASRFSEDPRNLSDGTSNEYSLGWRWYEQTTYLRTPSTGPPSLYDLQSCSLSAMYLIGTSISDSKWAIVGMGIRRAQEMGLHMKKKRGPDGQYPPRTVYDEFCIRAFWVLLNFDVILSMTYGRPRAITSEDFDVEYPLECDVKYCQAEDPEVFVQPPGVPSEISFFTSYCKLLEIVGNTQRALYSVNRSKFWKKMGNITSNWEQKAVTELDSALNQWFSSIPEHLKWDPNAKDSVFFRQSSVLHTSFYWAQMQVHGLFIHGRSGQSNSALRQPSFPSLEICTTAARCCVRIIDIQRRLHMQLPTMFLAPVFSSALILYLQAVRRKQTSNANKDIQGVYCCLEYMSSFEKSYLASGRLCDILRSIIYLGDQHFQSSQDNLETSNFMPEQLKHLGTGVKPTPLVNNLNPKIMTAGAEMVNNSESRSSQLRFNSSLFYGQAAMVSSSLSDLQSNNFDFTDSQWPMEVEPSGLAAEDWASFMMDVDEILNSYMGHAI